MGACLCLLCGELYRSHPSIIIGGRRQCPRLRKKNMSRGLILNQLDRDLACAIALGIVEQPSVVANADNITLQDAQTRIIGTEPGWLNGDDPLDAVTRAYLIAR